MFWSMPLKFEGDILSQTEAATMWWMKIEGIIVVVIFKLDHPIFEWYRRVGNWFFNNVMPAIFLRQYANNFFQGWDIREHRISIWSLCVSQLRNNLKSLDAKKQPDWNKFDSWCRFTQLVLRQFYALGFAILRNCWTESKGWHSICPQIGLEFNVHKFGKLCLFYCCVVPSSV